MVIVVVVQVAGLFVVVEKVAVKFQLWFWSKMLLLLWLKMQFALILLCHFASFPCSFADNDARLHEKCIAIWAQERRLHREKLICPLCRSDWADRILPVVDRSLRSAPSSTNTSPLSEPEPLSGKNEAIAKAWHPVVPLSVAKCLLSRQWNLREAGLQQLEQQVGQFSHDPALVFDTLCAVTNLLLHDAILKVFSAAVALFRAVFQHPSSSGLPLPRQQAALRPVLLNLLLLSSEIKKRAACLGLLVEAVRDPRVTPNFFISFAFEDNDMMSRPYRWWLGRVDFCLTLLTEYGDAIGRFATLEGRETLIGFLRQALMYGHLKVKQTAHRVVIIGYRLAQTRADAMPEIEAFLASLRPQIREDLLRGIGASLD